MSNSGARRPSRRELVRGLALGGVLGGFGGAGCAGWRSGGAGGTGTPTGTAATGAAARQAGTVDGVPPPAPLRPLPPPTPPPLPVFAARQISVRERGARGDGASNDSAAINRAISDCHAAGGGTVHFPAGTYLAASLRLQSGVRLQLAAGATLKALEEGYDPPEPNPFDKYQDFGHSHFRNSLLWGEGLRDVAIEGPGTIDGQALRGGNAPPGRGNKQIAIKSSAGLHFRNLRQVGGGHFFYLLTDCQGVTMADLHLSDGRDGIDLVGCRDVHLARLQVLDCGDDTIALKSDFAVGRRLESARVLVEDCVVESGCNGLQFGSETAGDFQHLHFRNVEVRRGGKAGIGVQSNDGGVIRDVVFENVRMRRVANPIFLNTTRRLRTPEARTPGHIENLLIRNVTAEEVVQSHRAEPANAATISGLPGVPHRNIRLQQVRILYKGGGRREEAAVEPVYSDNYNPRKLGPRPAYGFYVRHVKDLTFHDVEVGFETPDLRPAWVVKDAQGLLFERVRSQHAGGAAWPSLRTAEVRGLYVRDSGPLAAARME